MCSYWFERVPVRRFCVHCCTSASDGLPLQKLLPTHQRINTAQLKMKFLCVKMAHKPYVLLALYFLPFRDGRTGGMCGSERCRCGGPCLIKMPHLPKLEKGTPIGPCHNRTDTALAMRGGVGCAKSSTSGGGLSWIG